MNHIHCSNIEIAKAITPSGNRSYTDNCEYSLSSISIEWKHTLKTRILNRQVRISKVRLGYDLWLAREKTNRRIDGWKFCREIFDDLGEFSLISDINECLLNSLISEKSRSKYFRQGAEAYINFHHIRAPKLSNESIARECMNHIRTGYTSPHFFGGQKELEENEKA